MLQHQARRMGMIYTDHVNDHVRSKFHGKIGSAHTQICMLEMQWLTLKGGTGETYRNGKLPEPDCCLGWELGYPIEA